MAVAELGSLGRSNTPTSMLILLFIAAFVADALNSYLRLCVRRAVAQGYPPQMGVPFGFMGPGRVETVFLASLVLGLVLLCYGIYIFGFVGGVGCRIIPWIAGRIAAHVFYSIVESKVGK